MWGWPLPQANNDRMTWTGLRLQQERLKLGIRRISSLKWLNIWNGWSCHPWKCWRDGWDVVFSAVVYLSMWWLINGWISWCWGSFPTLMVLWVYEISVVPLTSWMDKDSLGVIRKVFLLDKLSTSVWCLSLTVTLLVWAGSVVPGRPVTFHVSLKQSVFGFLYKYRVCGEWTKPSSAFYSQFRLLRKRGNYF